MIDALKLQRRPRTVSAIRTVIELVNSGGPLAIHLREYDGQTARARWEESRRPVTRGGAAPAAIDLMPLRGRRRAGPGSVNGVNDDAVRSQRRLRLLRLRRRIAAVRRSVDGHRHVLETTSRRHRV